MTMPRDNTRRCFGNVFEATTPVRDAFVGAHGWNMPA